MWTSCINQIKQINDRLDSECIQIIEHKMKEMVKNYVVLNKELFKEIEKGENGKDIESFFRVNTMLVHDLGQKYTEIIGEILNYKMKRSDDLYSRMHEIAKRNNLCDEFSVKDENESDTQNECHVLQEQCDDDESTESDVVCNNGIKCSEENNSSEDDDSIPNIGDAAKDTDIDPDISNVSEVIDENQYDFYQAGINLKCPENCADVYFHDMNCFSFYTDFENHMEIFHDDTKPYKCNECDKNFAYKWILIEHHRVHTGDRPYKCKRCDKAFKQQSHIWSHMKCAHSDDRPHQCDKCDLSFKLKGILKEHIRNVHNREKNHECNICHKRFFNKRSWADHCRTHTRERPFKCEVCDKAFRTKGNLSQHKQIHSTEKLFECKKCKRRFQTRKRREGHQKKCLS